MRPVTLAVPVVALALLSLAAPPAFAVTEPPVQRGPWAFIDTSHDAPVLRLQAPGGPAKALTAAVASRSLADLAASRDGHRFAYLQIDVHDPNLLSQIVVRADDGTLIRVVSRSQYFPTNLADFRGPKLSPAGSRVVATHVERGEAPPYIGLFDVTNGASVKLPGSTGLSPLAWLTQRWLLADGPDGLVTTSANGGGPHQAVSGLTDADRDFVVSPNGHQLAWSRVTSGSADVETADIYVGDLTVSDTGVASVTDPTQVATGQDNEGPTWARDGLHVDFVQTSGADFSEQGKRGTAPADGSGSAALYVSSLSVSYVVDLA